MELSLLYYMTIPDQNTLLLLQSTWIKHLLLLRKTSKMNYNIGKLKQLLC